MMGKPPRKLLRGLLAVAIVALSVGVATPAAADQADCGVFWGDTAAGREYFTPAEEYVPPPLRPFAWDCASRTLDRAVPGPDGSFTYVVNYVDEPFETIVAIFRSFEQAGWTGPNEISTIDYREAESQAVEFGADDLAEAEAAGPLSYARARFGDERSGEHIIEATWVDSQEYDLGASESGLPVLELVLQLSGPFESGTGIADPSILSTLRTVAEAVPTPTQTAVLCGASVMLMLVVGFPGALLNSVVGSRYEQLRKRWLEQRAARRKEGAEPRRAPGWLVWPGFFVAAVVGGFVDPEFGFNLMSARMLVTAFWGFVLLNLLGWTFVRLVLARLQPDAKPYIKFRWGSLVLVALAVLLARLLQFEPGIIFGLVAGLAFAISLAAARDAQVTLLGAGFALAIALLGWVGYSALAPVADANPGQLWAIFFSEFFAGITIEGISALPLALLPLLLLDGAALFAWKKWVWAVAYTVGLAAFMLVLLTIPAAWGEVGGDFGRWVLLFTVFAVFSVAVWGINALLVRRGKKKAAAPPLVPPPEPAG
jgi:hypothetical protein